MPACVRKYKAYIYIYSDNIFFRETVDRHCNLIIFVPSLITIITGTQIHSTIHCPIKTQS